MLQSFADQASCFQLNRTGLSPAPANALQSFALEEWRAIQVFSDLNSPTIVQNSFDKYAVVAVKYPQQHSRRGTGESQFGNLSSSYDFSGVFMTSFSNRGSTSSSTTIRKHSARSSQNRLRKKPSTKASVEELRNEGPKFFCPCLLTPPLSATRSLGLCGGHQFGVSTSPDVASVTLGVLHFPTLAFHTCLRCEKSAAL